MKKKQTILVFAAHNDDGVIGAGGTLAKYAKQGKIVKTVVFSYGEGSHPHLKPEVIKLTRYKEALEADKILGGSGMAFLNLKEMQFKKQSKKLDTKKIITDIIKHEKPEKIFIHSINDPLPDHRAVYHVVMGIIDEINYKGEVYTFDVWNILNILHRNKPKLIVNVTNTFQKKIKAFKAHKSQRNVIYLLTTKIIAQAIINGLANGCRYAEVFVKIR